MFPLLSHFLISLFCLHFFFIIKQKGTSRIRSEMSIKISPYLRGFGQRPLSDTISPKAKKGNGLQDSFVASPVVLAAIEVDERRVGRPKGRRFLYAFLQNPPCPGNIAGTGAESTDPLTTTSCSSNYSGGGGIGSGSTSNSGAGSGRDSAATTPDIDTSIDVNNQVRMCSLRSYMEWTSGMPKMDNFVKPPNYK